MNLYGKLVGFMIGLVFFHNPLLVLVCVLLGHMWDRGMEAMRPATSAAPLSFIAPLFGLAGAIAKSDGRVSEAEIAAAERLMGRMQLNANLREAAIAQFNAGKEPHYSTTQAIVELRQWCAGQRERAFVLIDLLLDIVCAEGPLAPAKALIVRKLCAALGMSERHLASLAAMKGYAYIAPDDWDAWSRAQSGSYRRETPRTSSAEKDPYIVLGVARDASEVEIKRTYRKLMSQYHPDKLGDVPPELKRRAEDLAREINAAYDRIREERAIK